MLARLAAVEFALVSAAARFWLRAKCQSAESRARGALQHLVSSRLCAYCIFITYDEVLDKIMYCTVHGVLYVLYSLARVLAALTSSRAGFARAEDAWILFSGSEPNAKRPQRHRLSSAPSGLS